MDIFFFKIESYLLATLSVHLLVHVGLMLHLHCVTGQYFFAKVDVRLVADATGTSQFVPNLREESGQITSMQLNISCSVMVNR